MRHTRHWPMVTPSRGLWHVLLLCHSSFPRSALSGKWVIIGKMKEGDYPLWGTYYFRWWLVKSLERLTPMQFLNGTPLYPGYLRMLGVKVPDSAQLSAMEIGAEDLLTIGEDVSISSQVVINNAWVEDGLLKLRRVHLGDHAYLGSSAVVGGGAGMEEWGELAGPEFSACRQNYQDGEKYGRAAPLRRPIHARMKTSFSLWRFLPEDAGITSSSFPSRCLSFRSLSASADPDHHYAA